MLLLAVRLCKGGGTPGKFLPTSVSMSISTSVHRRERGENGEDARFLFRKFQRLHFTVPRLDRLKNIRT